MKTVKRIEEQIQDVVDCYKSFNEKPSIAQVNRITYLNEQLEYARKIEELTYTVSALESENKIILDTLLRANPDYIGWIKMNYPNYKVEK